MGNGRQTIAVADYSLIQRTLSNADQWNQFGKEETREGKSRWPKFSNWQGVIRLSRFVEREKKASTNAKANKSRNHSKSRKSNQQKKRKKNRRRASTLQLAFNMACISRVCQTAAHTDCPFQCTFGSHFQIMDFSIGLSVLVARAQSK